MASASHHSRLDLTCEPSAVPHARRHARDVLRTWDVPGDVLDDALVVVTELAANAVRHTGEGSRAPEQGLAAAPVCAVDLRTHEECLYVAVYDESRRAPVLRIPSDKAESGRGLHLVAELSGGTWGFLYTAGPPGKLVWACLALPSSWVRPRADACGGAPHTARPRAISPCSLSGAVTGVSA
ncbi:ATP-binding protein [Streptomyces sp. NBC_00669]|uniref:ATP-binding protein n=1 Tax=Streptomyces sp. NBC_00669 TaxID=2976011 RepID=UPI002E34CEEF|nr:ATP-binding protein [Streptomyces sp. NBC_00669]